VHFQEAKRQGELAANLQDGWIDDSSAVVNTVALTRQSVQVPNVVITQQLAAPAVQTQTQNLLRTSQQVASVSNVSAHGKASRAHLRSLGDI
jgi:hypothetical protein